MPAKALAMSEELERSPTTISDRPNARAILSSATLCTSPLIATLRFSSSGTIKPAAGPTAPTVSTFNFLDSPKADTSFSLSLPTEWIDDAFFHFGYYNVNRQRGESLCKPYFLDVLGLEVFLQECP